MPPTKVKAGAAKGANKRATKPAAASSSSKPKRAASKAPPSREHKPKPATHPAKKKRRQYTEAELGVPTLNMITPAGVQKPKGKKKGKVFVDDQASMMTILAMVNADKEGQIESKMLRARQMEEIRQARVREMEARADEKKQALEDKKSSLKRKRKGKADAGEVDAPPAVTAAAARGKKDGKPKKRVSFG